MITKSTPTKSLTIIAALGVLALGLAFAYTVMTPDGTPDGAPDGAEVADAPESAPQDETESEPEHVVIPDPATATGSYLAGHHAEAIGDSRTALQSYANATRLGLPATARLYSRMYILGLTEGRIDDALLALEKAEQLGGKPPLAHLTRAVQALRDGDYATAEALLADGDSGIAQILGPVLTAWARVGRQDIPGALNALNAVKKNKDEAPSALHLLHSALINDIAGNGPAAGALYVQLRTASGLSVRTAELMGQHLERSGRAADARVLYEALGTDAESLILRENLDTRLKTNTPPGLDVDSAQKGAAEALYGIASAMLSQNAWESALALAHMARALRPDFAPAAMVTAAALQQTNRRSDANALYEALPQRSPYAWLARLHLADNLDRMDRTDEALALLRTMSDERPTLARPLVELGDVLRRHDRFGEAADAYTLALARIAEPQESEWGLFYSRGVSYEQSDQWPKAEADFLKALELSPEQPAVLNYLGYLWIDKGQHLKRALDMIAAAVAKRPRDGAIVDSLGWGLYRTGDFKGAVKQLERATLLRPADPVINDHLGDALWRVGREREARFQWERALAMKPDATLTLAIEKKLKDGLSAAQP